MPVIMASMTVAGHRKHLSPGSAAGGIILLIGIAVIAMLVRRWHAARRRRMPPL
jgi:uncharacterized membrane protein YhaH (DUF805 family)